MVAKDPRQEVHIEQVAFDQRVAQERFAMPFAQVIEDQHPVTRLPQPQRGV